MFGLAGSHLARVLFIFGLVVSHLALFFLRNLATGLFTFGFARLHLARVLSTVCLVGLHLAWVLFNFGEGIVYFWVGWPTFG